jgi:broad specificity phosphatase PhoE
MGKIYYLRHGESEDNVAKRRTGMIHESDAALSQKGREQAEAAAEKLKDVPFDVMLVSPLLRTRQTAEIINRGRNVPMVMIDDLQERRGQHGLPEEILDDSFTFGAQVEHAGLEELDDLFTRAQKTIRKIEKDYAGKTVLVVGHAGYYWGVRAYYKDIARDGYIVDLDDVLGNADYRVYEMKGEK